MGEIAEGEAGADCDETFIRDACGGYNAVAGNGADG
jgi:hypothetical protein